MPRKCFTYILGLLVVLCASCQKDDDYKTPVPPSVLQNDCIKRSLGPNIVGSYIEFAYAMAIIPEKGHIVSAQVEASIPGGEDTYLENHSYYTNGSGEDVGVEIGGPSVTKDMVTEVTFTADTNAATLRYYYQVPEAARGKRVSFTFTARSSDGESVRYEMGPYEIATMDMTLDLALTDSDACYISVADMAVYNADEAAAHAGSIDLVYLYRSIPGVDFNHALVSPGGEPQYLPGVDLPAGADNVTKVRRAWDLRDRQLAREADGVFVDDPDLAALQLDGAPDYAINLKEEAGVWVETADGKYRAYIYLNEAHSDGSAVISMKRYTMP